MTVHWIKHIEYICPVCRAKFQELANAHNSHSCPNCGVVSCECGHTGLPLEENYEGGMRAYCEKCDCTLQYTAGDER